MICDQNFETDHSNIRRPQPSYLCRHVRHHDLFALPWTTQLWLTEDVCQHGALPSLALLHPRFRAADLARFTTVPRYHSTGTHSTNVWCQKHDGGLWSTTRTLPYGRLHVQVKADILCLLLLIIYSTKKLTKDSNIRFLYWCHFTLREKNILEIILSQWNKTLIKIFGKKLLIFFFCNKL